MSTFSLANKTGRFLFGERQIHPSFGWMLAILAAIASGYMTVKMGLLFPIGIAGLLVVGPFVVSAIWSLETGIYIILLLAYFISIPNRLVEGLPLGISIDVMISLMLTGLLYRCASSQSWKVFTSPISIPIFLWAGMNFIEVANPWAGSRAAWFYVIRPAVEYMMLFFLTYAALDTPDKMKRLIGFIFALTIISGIWGIWQANMGYFDWEYNYVLRHDLVHLVFNYGRWRAIGSIGSPAQFGIIMAFMSVFSFGLIGISRGWNKIFMMVTSIISLLAMVLSGTRSAYIIIPIYLFIWVVLSGKRIMYLWLVMFILVFAVVAVVPSNNYHIQRIQSTFKASEDASYQVRARNRAMIFPWILKHPIGGGLGSTGVWGQRFTPGSFLANFAPDSGLVRVAVELGWIGLFIFLNIYFTILYHGVRLQQKLKSAKFKSISGSLISALAPLLIVEWGQEVIGVFPMSLLFWIVIAILFRSIYFDQQNYAIQK